MRRAFSLIELSIVIVIIGLLVASIQAGVGVIKTAKTRALITDVKEYEAAYYAFFGTFGGYPGDLDNAASFWSTAINGDGDETIEYSSGDTSEESANAWVHMSLAEFIKYTLSANEYPEAEKDDLSKFILIYYTDLHSTHGNSITIERSDFSGTVTPVEAYQFDCKMDDCSPTVGTVYIDNGDGVTATSATCMDSSNTLNLKDVQTDECRIIYWLK